MVLAGYAALIHVFDLKAPLPEILSTIGERHVRYEQDGWRVFTPRHQPEGTLADHLTFALKYEGLDLNVLKALFRAAGAQAVADMVKAEPTGKYSRRIWFLYEWLLDERLDLPDTSVTNFAAALDHDLQYPGPSILSRRHGVRNNLPGVRDFCPLIRRTEKLDHMMTLRLDERARESTGAIHPDVLTRAAAFLLLKDSKASYAIEGEQPARTKTERWGRALAQAGLQPLRPEELLRLQQIVIGDRRFAKLGWRKEGGFVGTHDRMRGRPVPIPDHISARWQDVPRLIDGVIAANELLKDSAYDPVLAAALIAFGFLFIHPFEDGNGRIHRYLIHHVLSEKGFAPKGIVFPVSAVILERIDDYRLVLEATSRPLLEFIDWKPTESGNVEVLNETIDLYRYFDATRQAEFLYECVQTTVDETLPAEVAYLEAHDAMRGFIADHFDMPERLSELLIGFLRQGKGKMSSRARTKEFSSLTDAEIAMLETKYADVFIS